MTEEIRAFIAVEMSPDMKSALSALQDRLQPRQHPYAKWVDPQGIHLTLKFLGNVKRSQVTDIERAIAQGSTGVSPVRLQLGGLGAFPNLGRPRVIWVALTGDVEPLAALQSGIDQALLPLGFSRESRAFTPHLTLARLRERASPEERRKLGEVVRATALSDATAMEANEVSLMRSTLTPQGATYTCLARAALTGGLSPPSP